MPSTNVSQIDLFSCIMKFLSRQGIKTMLPREVNMVASCATMIVDEIAKPEMKTSPGMGLEAWLQSDDTGVGSVFMAAVLLGRYERPYGHPHDPDDFGRCFRLLEAAPELRTELPRLAQRSVQWKALVSAWDELESLYKLELPSKRCPKLYAKMQELLKE